MQRQDNLIKHRIHLCLLLFLSSQVVKPLHSTYAMSPPARMDALVVKTSNNTPRLVKESLPTPKPGDHQLLVKVSHVAQNPTDGIVCPC
jgi:hypothetical protein